MSIIDFKQEFKRCDKSITQITQELYKKEKDNLQFKIGDKVKVIINENHPLKNDLNALRDKIFNIIDVKIDWSQNDFFYVLDTNICIQLFTAHQLIKI